MSDKDEILAALAALRTENVSQQVALQRAVDRIANDHVALRQGVQSLEHRIGAVETKLDTRVKHSDHVHSSASEVDAKHESDLAAVIVRLESTRADVAEVKGQQHALMAVNQRQSAILEFIRGTPFKRLVSQTTKLVGILAAIAAAYLAAKGHK